MKKLLYLLSTLIIVSIIACDPVEEVKAKWMQWANDNVDQELHSLLKQQNISIDEFNQQSLWEKAIATIDYFLPKDLQQKSISEHMMITLAKSIFTDHECKEIKLYDDGYNTPGSIGISKHHATGTCILLSKIDQTWKTNELESALRHEKAHLVYNDEIHFIKLSCLPKNKVYDPAALRRAQETRADVYSIITSPDYGEGGIAFALKDVLAETDSDRLDTLTHPTAKDRLHLLKQIKSEIQSAEQEKQYMTTATQAMNDEQLI